LPGVFLDSKTVTNSLSLAQAKAQKKRQAYDQRRNKTEALRAVAAKAEEAASLSDRATVLEEELRQLIARIDERADIRLGALLQARMVKPSAVVTSWGSSRVEHIGELSKRDFRRAVLRLFNGLDPVGKTREDSIHSKGSVKTPATARLVSRSASQRTYQSEAEASAEEAELAAEIDGVFDTFDADRNGWLDADETLSMVRTLQGAANQATGERRMKEKESRLVRSRADRLGVVALREVRDAVCEHSSRHTDFEC
jgi:hypothetical protein